MLVRCSHCGYQNNEHYRFCGMCGALLRLSDAETAPSVPESTASPVRPPAAKPAPAPAPNLDYLLEDEPEDHGPRRRMYLALVLLAIAGGVLVWQFSRGRESRLPSSLATTQPGVASPAGSDAVPASNATADGAPLPSTASGGHETPAPAQPTKPNAQEASSAPPPANSTPPVTATVNLLSPDLQPAPTAEIPSSTPATGDQLAHNATPNPAPPPKPVATKSSSPAPTQPQVPPAAAGSADDKLLAAGEKYLYGSGVAENCALAQKNLRAAAQRSNTRAQSILGTMYATGHCVDRDLPMAYRWFAKALHQDPNNNRIQRDLEVLWRQMTADERQLAIRP